MTIEKLKESVEMLFSSQIDKETIVVTKKDGDYVELNGIDLTISTEYVLDNTGAYARKNCLIIG